MIKSFLLFISLFPILLLGQTASLADSIRIHYKIPELAYAVITSDSILEIKVLGTQRIHAHYPAKINDRFRIGSNTKLITAFIAAKLVKQNKLNWDTPFFDIYPELKSSSNSAYHTITLQDLLCFKAKLISWTYTYQQPNKKEIKGNEQEQRYEFISWVLKQTPQEGEKAYYWSNPSYVAAGLMLEKVSGKTYEELVAQLSKELNVRFEFGQPNFTDKLQPWGHDANYNPEKPSSNYKLNWLSSAGNLNISLPDYCKFIQEELKGKKGRSSLLTQEEFNYLFTTYDGFSFGWQTYLDEKSQINYYYHKGNPGTFLSKTFVCKEKDLGFIFFTNIQADNTEVALDELFRILQKKFE